MNLDIGIDTLEVIGIVLGVLVFLIGLATLADVPRTLAGNVAVAIARALAALATVGIGVGLVWLARR